jgi:hypothetical protein
MASFGGVCVDLNDTPETLSDSCDAGSADAHGFDDLGRYVTWLLDQPSSAYPSDRLAAEAACPSSARTTASRRVL